MPGGDSNLRAEGGPGHSPRKWPDYDRSWPEAAGNPAARPRFLVGANLPWLSYGGDFGRNAWWPDGGLGRPGGAAALDDALAPLAAAGLEVVRWFVLCDGRAGIDVDVRGVPTGLDACVRRDLDAALAALSRHRLRAVFVMLDFLLVGRARRIGGVHCGGKRFWLATSAARRALVDLVLRPLAAHVGPAPEVVAWDLFNEPEWVTLGEGGWPLHRCVWRHTMRAFLAEATAVVRAESPAPVTVGLASTRGLDLVRGIGLDVYQVHWYDHVDDPSALVTPVDAHRLDRPLLLGEFPTVQSSQSPLAILSAVRHAGYAGALAWSALAGDRFSSGVAVREEVGGWARRHAPARNDPRG